MESVYQKALAIELNENELQYETEVSIPVYYNDSEIGEFFADFVVENKVILELKAVSESEESHESQLLNYLNATNYEVGLLLNFGAEPSIKRKVFDNEVKDYKRPEG